LERFEFAPDERASHITSMAFVRGIWELLVPLCGGATLELFDRDVVKDPQQLVRQLAQSRITRIVTAPSLLRALLQFKAHHKFDISCIRYWFVSGEALTVDLAQQVASTFNHAEFFNLYGSTEVVSDVLYTAVNESAAFNCVPLGLPISGVAATIADSQLNPVPDSVIGELIITGASVNTGYDGLPELSKKQFIDTPVGRGYRTGDLARRLDNGQIGYVGRADHQVKVRGYRIELGEIEVQLAKMAEVKDVVVVAKGEPVMLLAYFTAASGDNNSTLIETVKTKLRETLPQYMIPAMFVVLDEFPLTPNGKVNRTALPKVDASTLAVDFVAPQSPTEQILVRIWVELLALENDRLSVTANFFAIGGNSLLCVTLAAEVREHLKVALSIRDIFNTPVLSQLATVIDSRERVERVDVTAVKRPNKLPASFAQQRLWLIDQMSQGSSHYNMPQAIEVKGPFDVAKAERAFAQLIERHEPLRTVFVADGEQCLQVINDGADFTISRLTAPDDLTAIIQADATRPFALDKDLMLRVSLIKLGNEHHVLLINTHHIASDGWSQGIISREFTELYNGHSLTPLALGYADFALWQRNWAGAVLETQLDYWRNQLADLPALHSVPLDYTRPAKQTFNGAHHFFAVERPILDGLNALAQQHNATLFMILHGAFAFLLSRYGSTRDIVIGTPVANRTQKSLQSLVGIFVNTLVLRLDCDAQLSFIDYLAQVKNVNLDAQSNQDVPFEHLVEQLNPQRTMQYSPLFQVVISLNDTLNTGTTTTAAKQGDLTFTPMHSEQVSAKFELNLVAQSTDKGLGFNLLYNTDLFAPDTIKAMGQHLSFLLRGIVADP
ncbi:MAG: AMP-binding protein, partial [Algicola sp.]|nr:AMP-binding protein [Algicola sp.]